jgi:hypothetical protein
VRLHRGSLATAGSGDIVSLDSPDAGTIPPAATVRNPAATAEGNESFLEPTLSLDPRQNVRVN